MKALMENWKRFVNEKKGNKKIPHSWATHGHRRSDENKEIGEVLNHSLTEDGKIEFYEVKFGDVTKTLSEDDFVVTSLQEHTHEAKGLEDEE